MKAMVLEAVQQPLVVKDVPVPAIGGQDVLIRVQACGTCHTDLHLSEGMFVPFGVNKFPLIPGHEVTGIVDRIGAQVTHLKPGDRVGVYFVFGCGHCPYCVAGEDENCSTIWTGSRLGGFSLDGGYAEYMRAPADCVMRLPEELDFVDAAPFFCAGLTMYGGIKNGGYRPGQRVAVLGIGGLGHMGLQIANAMGAEVIAVTATEAKKELAHSLGAHHVIIGTGGDVGAQLRALGGANVVLSTTLDPQLIAGAMQGLANEGSLVLTAVTVESLPVVPALLLAFQHRIVGSLVGSRGDMQELLQLAAKHNIRPMTEVYPLEQANEVHARLRAQQVRFRAVLTPG